MIELQATPETQQAQRDFLDLLGRLHRPTVAVRREVGRSVRLGFSENFVRQRAGDGSAWAPLAPATIRDRIRQGYGPGPKLFRTGRLLRSYVEEFHSEHAQRFRILSSGYQMEYGSDTYYARFHESGTQSMPARPVTLLSRRAENGVEAALDNYFGRVFRAAGF